MSDNDTFSKEMDSVREHEDFDFPVVVKIDDNLPAGTYTVTIEVVEDGDPWENTRTVELELVVEEVEDDSTE
jgi:methionine-rich copper-binding protein CopC